MAEDQYYSQAVAHLAARGVLAGTECDEGFCPDEVIDRQTMAVWVVRMLDGENPPSISRSRFGDVDAGSLHAPFIERMADLGVTSGCGDGTNFCPHGSVTRAQMAAFLSRAYNLADGPAPGFADVAADAWYAADVARLAWSGITSGCGDGSVFCPHQPTTRAQTAAFLWRAEDRFGQPASVSLSVGSSAQGVVDEDGDRCTSVHCRWFHIDAQTPGPGPYAVECWHEAFRYASRDFPRAVFEADTVDELPTEDVCFFGFPDVKVWAVVNGVKSNEVTWPQGGETPELSEPRNVRVVAGDGSLTVSWDAPARTAGLIDYDVAYRCPSSSSEREWRPEHVSSTQRSVTITGLTNGVACSIRVWAHSGGRNAQGGGDAYASGTPEGLPEPPQDGVAVEGAPEAGPTRTQSDIGADGCPTRNKYIRDRDGLWPSPHRIISRQQFKTIDGKTVRVDQKGGIVSRSNDNLAQSGCSWIGFDAKVDDRALVSGDALVTGGAHIKGTAKVTGEVHIDGRVTIDSGLWNGWAEFVRPLETVHEKLFNDLYKPLRNCGSTRSMSDEDVKKMVRTIIALPGSVYDSNDRTAHLRQLDACLNLRAFFGILKAASPSVWSLLEVFNVGKIIVAGKLLLDLKNVFDSYKNAVDGANRQNALGALRQWYIELRDNVCRNEADCQTRLRLLISR